MVRKKLVHCSICGKRGVSKATHCDVCYKNNAVNCHHSKAKGMCPFDNDNNNNIKKFLIDKNTTKTKDVNKGYEKNDILNNQINECNSSKKETQMIASCQQELIIPLDNKSSFWGWLFKVANKNSWKLIKFVNNGESLFNSIIVSNQSKDLRHMPSSIPELRRIIANELDNSKNKDTSIKKKDELYSKLQSDYSNIQENYEISKKQVENNFPL